MMVAKSDNRERGDRSHCNESFLRIGTLNVQGLAYKLSSVLALALTLQLDILCLQETNLTIHSIPSAQLAAASAGWNLVCSSPSYNKAERGYAGVAFLSRWPLQMLEQASGIDTARWMTIRGHRPNSPPFELTNLYLHSGDKRAAAHLAASILESCLTRGNDSILIGDWNLTPREEPIFSSVLSGAVHLGDDILGPDVEISTRHGGRHIDYCLHTVNFAPFHRGQETGDHDLVFFGFQIGRLEPCFRKNPFAKLQLQEAVSEEEWIRLFDGNSFFHHLHDDLDEAWSVLSNTAFMALKPKTGSGKVKGDVSCPVQVPLNHKKASSLMSFKERKLTRLSRLLREFQLQASLGKFDFRLHNNLWRRWNDLCPHFERLRVLDFSHPDSLDLIRQCLEEENAGVRSRRLTSWKNRLQNSDPQLFSWLRRQPQKADEPAGVPIHPQQKVEHHQNIWKQLWNPPSVRSVDEVQPWLATLPPGVFQDSLSFTGGMLRELTFKKKDKAHGADGWRPSEWLLLPNAFFDHLALLWTRCLQLGRVPTPWLHIRCVLIPKEDGSLWPISVTSIAWRVGMSAILQNLQPWIESWLPSYLLGGLKNRGIRETHEQLHAEIFGCSSLGQVAHWSQTGRAKMF
jgi:endonuclease/exonuclease/phosphatase family metal-dependent hydrolase